MKADILEISQVSGLAVDVFGETGYFGGSYNYFFLEKHSYIEKLELPAKCPLVPVLGSTHDCCVCMCKYFRTPGEPPPCSPKVEYCC